VVGVEALKFGIEVRRKDAFLRGQLQCIRKRIVPLAEEPLPVASAALRTIGGFRFRFRFKTVFQVIAKRAQQCFIGPGMEPPDAVVLVLFFDQAQRRSPVLGSKTRTPMFTHSSRTRFASLVPSSSLTRMRRCWDYFGI